MIVEKLLHLVYTLLSTLLTFGLPALPQSVIDTANSAKSFFIQGLSIIRIFLDENTFSLIATLLGLVIAFNAAYIIYSLAFWIIRKIPIVDVKE